MKQFIKNIIWLFKNDLENHAAYWDKKVIVKWNDDHLKDSIQKISKIREQSL